MQVGPTYEELLQKVLELEREAFKGKKAEKRSEILEMQLRQAQKMEAIGMLAGGIAHDFNNILASIIGYAELSIEDVERGGFLESNLRQILTAGKRARDLVKQILTFTRLARHEKMPVALNPILQEVCKMLRSVLPSTIEIRLKTCPQLLTVISEPSQIHQVIVNLCTNAAQAMADGDGVLEVRLGKRVFDETVKMGHPEMEPGKYACIEVSDNGPGMTPEVLKKIFEPYFTTKEESKGTGLGLAVVKGIVKSNDGHISAGSTPGAGTEFVVYLPLASEEKTVSNVETGTSLPVGAGKILFVDDEPIIVNMQKHILERLGYTVTAENNSLEALARFRSGPMEFDAVITDMTMPGMTGDELALAVKQIRPDIPVVLCTGFSERISADDAMRFGIDDFLMKPVEKATLALALKRVLKN